MRVPVPAARRDRFGQHTESGSTTRGGCWKRSRAGRHDRQSGAVRSFFETGQISFAPERTKAHEESKTRLDRLGVKTEFLTHADLVRRYPQVNPEGINLGIYTPSTGVLKAREGCQAVADAFQK